MMVSTRRLRGERGANAVEFALVAPLLFGLIAVAITGGLAFTHYALVHRSAEHAARVAAVPSMDMQMVRRSYATDEEVEDAASQAAVLFEPTTVEVSCRPSTCAEGGRVTVRVTYAWDNPVASLLGGLTDGADDSFLFTAQARRVIE